MFVKKTTKYWKEVTTTEEVEYTILYSGLGSLSGSPIFAVKGDPEVGKKLYNLNNLNLELVGNTMVYTFDIDKSDSGYSIVSISGQLLDPLNGAFTYKEVVITPNKPGIPGGNTVLWSLSTTYTKTEIETVTVTQPATPDDYTYKEEDIKQYAITKRYIAHEQGDFKPDYTIVGSPTITDNGVVSGFSKTDYPILSDSCKSTNNAEYVFKFTTGSLFSGRQVIFHAEYFINAEITSGKAVTFYNWSDDIARTLFTASENTTYWIKVLVDGNKKTYSYSTDGKTYVGDKLITDTAMNVNSTTYRFKLGQHGKWDLNHPFKGSIDLSESYIKINGEYFWSGFYTSNEYGYKNYIPIVKRWGKLDFQFEYESAGTYTVEIPYDGEYELTVVGGGAGGAFVYSAKFWDGAAAGGSGGGFIGVTHLTKGTYTVTVGAGGAGNFNNNSATSCTAGYGGDSKFGDIVTAGGATAPTARYDAGTQTGSIGGTVRYDASDFSSVSLASNGNTGYGSNQADGGTYAGGASVYEGYGAGGQAAHGACKAGTAGYVKIKAVNVYGYKETRY